MDIANLLFGGAFGRRRRHDFQSGLRAQIIETGSGR